MAKPTAKAKRGIGRLLTWPWRRLSWRGKLVMVPAIAAALIYGSFWLANVLFGIAY